MGHKKNDIGTVIAQVGGLRIRQKQIFGMVTIEGSRAKVRQLQGTNIGIFAGKKMIENGFKNKETAMARAAEIDAQMVAGTFVKSK